jgi:hypothetical protein
MDEPRTPWLLTFCVIAGGLLVWLLALWWLFA